MESVDKYKLITNVINGGNKVRAQISLGRTLRYVNKLINKYDCNNANCFVHGNCGRTRPRLFN
ncbi:hypothetical protein FACS189459_3840 [Bacilli bacterium]|nr:hypothetical protein FACS189459_3840 [Bacilli bacterium]